jgi:gliding motility-associated-like protein
MKVLKSILFILLVYISYSQQYPDLGSNQTLPYGVSSTILTANLNQPNQLNNPRETTNYTVSNIPYTTQVNNGNIIPNMGLTTYSPMLEIGFNFCFFGQSYSQFYINSSGWISFTPQFVDPNWIANGLYNTPQNACPNNSNTPLPNNTYNNPKNCIFGAWQMWNPISTFGGSIKYETQGIAPNRKLIVSWVEVPLQNQLYNSPNSNNNGNFHIVLYESTNIIDVYIQSKPSYSWFPFYEKATQGLYDLNGTNFIGLPNRNTTIWSAFNDAVRWTPSGNEIIPSLVWYEVGNPTPIGFNVNSIDVTPSTNGSYYTCHFEYPSCNGDWITYTYPNTTFDTVLIKPAISIIDIPEDIIEDIHVNDSIDSILPSPEPSFDTIVEQYCFIPNSFTPDGNEFNNIFYPIFSDDFIFNNFYFAIYNTWGELIYESSDPHNYWDGSYNNKNCPVGVYVYVVNVNNKIISGHVNLIK